jgi:pilus assembly protein Flp/PilA
MTKDPAAALAAERVRRTTSLVSSLLIPTRQCHNLEEAQMNSLVNSVKTFLVSEDGPTAVEYAVMLALIIIVCLTAIKAVGTTANDRFTDVKNALTPAP